MTRSEDHENEWIEMKFEIPEQPEEEEPKPNKTATLAGLAAFAIIIGIMLVVYLSPRELVINDRDPIEMFTGEKAPVVAYDQNFIAADPDEVVWEIDNEKVLTLKGNYLYAHYDKASFKDTAGKSDQAKEGTPCCRTKIHAKVRQGLSSWEGTQNVYIYLREE